MSEKSNRRIRIKAHIRTKITGTAERPRLTVFRSNTQIYAQIIDDVKGVTLASASSLGSKDKVTKTEQAALVGKLIADKAKSANIQNVKFDRSGYLYHGRIKALADGAREGGLQF